MGPWSPSPRDRVQLGTVRSGTAGRPCLGSVLGLVTAVGARRGSLHSCRLCTWSLRSVAGTMGTRGRARTRRTAAMSVLVTEAGPSSGSWGSRGAQDAGDDWRCCCCRERVARKTVCELQSGRGHTAPQACSRVTSPGNLVAQGQVFSLHKAQKQCLHRRGAICRGCCVFAPRPYGSALGWTFRVLQRLQTAPHLPLTSDMRVSPQCRWKGCCSLLRGPVGRMSSCADVLWEERW